MLHVYRKEIFALRSGRPNGGMACQLALLVRCKVVRWMVLPSWLHASLTSWLVLASCEVITPNKAGSLHVQDARHSQRYSREGADWLALLTHYGARQASSAIHSLPTWKQTRKCSATNAASITWPASIKLAAFLPCWSSAASSQQVSVRAPSIRVAALCWPSLNRIRAHHYL